MKCPNCGTVIDHVRVVSECYQDSCIDENGKILDYATPEVSAETLSIECPECSCDIKHWITEI